MTVTGAKTYRTDLNHPVSVAGTPQAINSQADSIGLLPTELLQLIQQHVLRQHTLNDSTGRENIAALARLSRVDRAFKNAIDGSATLKNYIMFHHKLNEIIARHSGIEHYAPGLSHGSADLWLDRFFDNGNPERHNMLQDENIKALSESQQRFLTRSISTKEQMQTPEVVGQLIVGMPDFNAESKKDISGLALKKIGLNSHDPQYGHLKVHAAMHYSHCDKTLQDDMYGQACLVLEGRSVELDFLHAYLKNHEEFTQREQTKMFAAIERFERSAPEPDHAAQLWGVLANGCKNFDQVHCHKVFDKCLQLLNTDNMRIDSFVTAITDMNAGLKKVDESRWKKIIETAEAIQGPLQMELMCALSPIIERLSSDDQKKITNSAASHQNDPAVYAAHSSLVRYYDRLPAEAIQLVSSRLKAEFILPEVNSRQGAVSLKDELIFHKCWIATQMLDFPEHLTQDDRDVLKSLLAEMNNGSAFLEESREKLLIKMVALCKDNTHIDECTQPWHEIVEAVDAFAVPENKALMAQKISTMLGKNLQAWLGGQ